MTIKNICTKKTYQKNGEEKAFWPIVGVLKIMDDGKYFMELNMFPNTPFYCFDQKKKEPVKPAPAADDFNPEELDLA